MFDYRLKCEYKSDSEESGDEYQRDEDDNMAINIHPVKQQSFPDPPYSSPVNIPGTVPDNLPVRFFVSYI